MDSPNPNSSVSNNMTSPPFFFRDINWATVKKDDGKFRAMAFYKLGESFIQELSFADTDAVIKAALTSCFTLPELQLAYALTVGGAGAGTDTDADSVSFECKDSAVLAILNEINNRGEDADSAPAPQPAPTAAAAAAAAPPPTPSSPATAPAAVAVAATPVAATATTKVKAVVGVVDNVSGPVVSVTPNNRGDGSPNPKR